MATGNGAGLTLHRQALLELYIRGTSAGRPVIGTLARDAAARDPAIRIEPCSHAQSRLWFMTQLQDQYDPYILHSVQELDWAVAPALLKQALDAVVARHEILRTTIELHDDGRPWQHVATTGAVPLLVDDLQGLPKDDRHSEVAHRVAGLLAQRMDLERGPLITAALYQLDEEQWLFLLAAHHIIFDGPSFSIFFDELRAAYAGLVAGQAPALPAAPPQYATFAARQEATLTDRQIAAEARFWTAELNNLPMLELPLDRQRPAAPTFRGATHSFSVPPDITARLRALGASQRATLFMVLLGGLSATLSRICGQTDFAIGLPAAGRDEPQMQRAIGFFVDTVVVRCRLEDDPTVATLLERTRTAVSRSLGHRLPFDLLVEHLRPARTAGVNPIFQVGFQLTERAETTGPGSPVNVARAGAMFDLELDTWTDGAGLGCRLEYNTDIFEPATAESIAAAFVSALGSMPSSDRRVSELAVWRADRPADQSVQAGAIVRRRHRSAMALLTEVAAQHPDALAVDDGQQSLTYRQLFDWSAALAAALIDRGVVRGSFVALALPRSAVLVAMQLACWRAGAAFAPTDPQWPADRHQQVLAALAPALVITPEVAADLTAETGRPARPVRRRKPGPASPAVPIGPGDAAYAIFTSGSTGVPKGVVLEHAGLINVVMAQRRIFGLAAGRRVAQLASPTFDASVFEFVLALGSGATLVIAPPEPIAGDELAQFLNARAADTVVVPPSLLATIRPVDAPGLRLICVAGESCRVDLAAQWQVGREFWNLYGPTETTIWATYGRGQTGARVPIGVPIPNLTTEVVDAGGRAVAVGVAGELIVRGTGVARGYLNEPELTAIRFGRGRGGARERFYRTGDLVRQQRSGELVFLGRVDRQVKVRGFRIEPEEVEAVLRRHPHAADAVVEARSPDGGAPVLTAWVQCPAGTAQPEELRRLVVDALPHYMVPSHVVVLPEFPRSSSGKVDRAALPGPSAQPEGSFVPPQTPTEHQVATLMARATRMPRVGAADDFFSIGGHSLAAAELVSHARRQFRVDLTIRDVFAHRTVAELAAHIDSLAGAGDAGAQEEIPLVRLPRGGRPATALPGAS